jgi:hypothetical protein
MANTRIDTGHGGTITFGTITWPVAPGGTTAANYAGTGLVTRVKFPTLQTNQVQIGEISVKWSGGTPPAWTAGN